MKVKLGNRKFDATPTFLQVLRDLEHILPYASLTEIERRGKPIQLGFQEVDLIAAEYDRRVLDQYYHEGYADVADVMLLQEIYDWLNAVMHAAIIVEESERISAEYKRRTEALAQDLAR